LNIVNEGAEVTLWAGLFHARAAVTRNEWSPIVRSCICAMICYWWELECRRCRASALSV